MSRTVPIARKNLIYNSRRLLAALAGVVFAVVLVNTEMGILYGFVANSSAFIDRMPADVWVMAPGTRNFDQPYPIPSLVLQRVRSIEGVQWAEPLAVLWTGWKLSDGTQEIVQVIGLPEEGHLPIPWNVTPAKAREMINPHGVIVDMAERERLGVTGIDQEAEISNLRVTVVGFTEGLRSFTTSPYVLMRFNRVGSMTPVVGGVLTYVLAKSNGNPAPEELRDRIQTHLPDYDILTAGQFRNRTWLYWLFSTGVGTGFLISGLLGFCVGGAVVGQVLYAMVVEQRAEFGVLKAIGAENRYLCRVILQQAFIIALVGYGVGMLATWPVMAGIKATGTPFRLFWQLIAGGFVTTVAVCLGSAIIPVLNVLKLEPALVFRGMNR